METEKNHSDESILNAVEINSLDKGEECINNLQNPNQGIVPKVGMDSDQRTSSDDINSKVLNKSNTAGKLNTDLISDTLTVQPGVALILKPRCRNSRKLSGEENMDCHMFNDDGSPAFDVDVPPCECDDCILNENVIEVSAEKPPVKRSSWKKIRNIVHWSPFIQQFKRRRYPWIQLAGHQGNFQAGEPGAILKKFDPREQKSFTALMKDILRPYVPEYRGDIEKNRERFLQLQDLLCEFEAPCVMDVKMGCRTYLEEELSKARQKPTLRKDMYQKMVEVDPSAPTEEEHSQKAITKPRYMQWRDDMSSSVEMGFRIEGIRKSDGSSSKNFKKTKSKESVIEALKYFVGDSETVLKSYIRRLKSIRATQESSQFFKSHEIIGSSLLFVHDKTGQASVWMIDFGKTVKLPETCTVDHRAQWVEGNHEDGYLIGMDSMISLFEDILQTLNSNSKSSDDDNSNPEENSETTKL